MIKLSNLEKLYLILHQDRILKQCRTGKCGKCPIGKFEKMKVEKLIRDWPCIELYDFFGGEKNRWKMLDLFKAMQRFYREINQEISND